MTIATAFVACKDDDDDKKPTSPSNLYTFDGESKEIKTARFEDNTDEDGGGYSFYLYPLALDEFDEEKPYEAIWIDIPKEMMGAKFELTEEKLYRWGWFIEFVKDEDEIYYEGFGAPGDMEDVKSGTMSAIKKGDDIFAIEVDIVFTDGKTLKVSWDGKMKDADWEDEPGRKPAKNNN